MVRRIWVRLRFSPSTTWKPSPRSKRDRARASLTGFLSLPLEYSELPMTRATRLAEEPSRTPADTPRSGAAQAGVGESIAMPRQRAKKLIQFHRFMVTTIHLTLQRRRTGQRRYCSIIQGGSLKDTDPG